MVSGPGQRGRQGLRLRGDRWPLGSYLLGFREAGRVPSSGESEEGAPGQSEAGVHGRGHRGEGVPGTTQGSWGGGGGGHLQGLRGCRGTWSLVSPPAAVVSGRALRGPRPWPCAFGSTSVVGSAFAVISAGENCVSSLRVFLRQQWGSCPVPALSGRHLCPFLGAPEHCQGLHGVSTTLQGVNAGSWGGEDLILHKPRDTGHEWICSVS